MRNKDSLTLLRLKMLGGYVSLLIVFIIASCIIVTKSGALEENGHRYKENVERRTLSENAFLQRPDTDGRSGSYLGCREDGRV